MKEQYFADKNRYDCGMEYERCGRSGVLLPKVSLGFWHNFGSVDPYERSREITHYAFDHGITHFDLANNYGPVYGSAEETMGRLMDEDFRPYRDELFISTKAGYDMWPGPYGNWGSRKYLMASLDQSLRRMKIDYVDLFYSHRYDPDTPLEETLQALVDAAGEAPVIRMVNTIMIEALKTKASDIHFEAMEKTSRLRYRIDGELVEGDGHHRLLRREGYRLHRLLAPGTRTAHRPLSAGHTRRQPHGQGEVPQELHAHPRAAREAAPLQRRGPEPWRDPGRDGPRLDPPPARRHLRPRRCQLHHPAREEPQMRHRRPLRRSALTPQWNPQSSGLAPKYSRLRLYFGA